MKKAVVWIITILAVLVTAGLSTLFSQLGMEQFDKLTQPPFAPPDIVFPIVWSILYALTAISAGIYFTSGKSDGRGLALFIVMAALNVLWSLCVFTLGILPAGVAVILAYIAVLWLTLRHVYKANKWCGILLIPHLLWLLLALALNYSLVMLNP